MLASPFPLPQTKDKQVFKIQSDHQCGAMYYMKNVNYKNEMQVKQTQLLSVVGELRRVTQNVVTASGPRTASVAWV